MTEPLTFIRYELDEQTRDELQPPCDVYRYTVGPNPPCPNPAAWLLHVKANPEHDHLAAYLICGAHLDMVLREYARACCRITSVEPLR